jgi:CysZ protein
MADPSLVPVLSRQPSALDFFRGLALPFSAISLIFRTSRLRALSLLAAFITFLTLTATVVVWALYTDDLLARFIPRPESTLGQVGWWVLWLLAFLLAVVVTASTVPTLLLAPLEDPISEATEELCGDFTSPPFSLARVLKEASTSVAHTLARIILLLAGQALLFTLNVIPGIGSLAWTVLGTAWAILWLATERLDAPMVRHLYRFRDVRALVRRRLSLCMGFGAAVYLMLWIPLLNFFFIPVAVVAGTLLFRALRASGDLGPPAAAALRSS